MANDTITPKVENAVKQEKSGGFFDWLKTDHAAKANAQYQSHGSEAETPSAGPSAETKAKQDEAYEEMMKRTDKLMSKELSVMEGGVPIGKLLSVAGNMATSIWGPGDVRMLGFAVRERDGIAKMFEAEAIGKGRDTKLISGARVINALLTAGKLTKENAAMALQEIAIEVAGDKIGKESLLQRMIPAALLAAEKPIEHATVHQMEIAQHAIEGMIKKGGSPLEGLPDKVGDRYASIMNYLKKEVMSQESDAVLESQTITPPPVTPARSAVSAVSQADPLLANANRRNTSQLGS